MFCSGAGGIIGGKAGSIAIVSSWRGHIALVLSSTTSSASTLLVLDPVPGTHNLSESERAKLTELLPIDASPVPFPQRLAQFHGRLERMLVSSHKPAIIHVAFYAGSSDVDTLKLVAIQEDWMLFSWCVFLLQSVIFQGVVPKRLLLGFSW